MDINRMASAVFSGENAVLNLDLLSAQNGMRRFGSGVVSSCFDNYTLSVSDLENGYVTLSYLPTVPIEEIYAISSSKHIGIHYEPVSAGTKATNDAFYQDGRKVYFPTSLKANSEITIIYDHIVSSGVGTGCKASDVNQNYRFVFDMLGHFVGDEDTKLFAYLVIPDGVLNTDYELNFNPDSPHPFSIEMFRNYTSGNTDLYQLIVIDGSDTKTSALGRAVLGKLIIGRGEDF